VLHPPRSVGYGARDPWTDAGGEERNAVLIDNGRTYLPNSTWCFVCGEDNPAGLKARFYVEDGVVKVPMAAAPHHCGYPNAVHGGVVAAALDECMGWAAARAVLRMCVTAELKVRYVRRVPTDIDLTVCGTVKEVHKRYVLAKGEIVDGEGTVYARSEGKFFPLTKEQTLEVDDQLLYRGGEERVFQPLREAD